ncbi:MAG: hypothetical protein LBN01_03790 [Endomicrobium sp.]|nr:hypothetical protein [Endomicrobium sp.]
MYLKIWNNFAKINDIAQQKKQEAIFQIIKKSDIVLKEIAKELRLKSVSNILTHHLWRQQYPIENYCLLRNYILKKQKKICSYGKRLKRKRFNALKDENG